MASAVLGPYTLAQLNALTPPVTAIAVVTDSANCTSQTGGQVQLCRYVSAGTWASIGGSGGAATAATVTISTSSPVTVDTTLSQFRYNNSAGAMTFTLPTITSGLVGMQVCLRNYTTRTGALTLQSPASTFIDQGGANSAAAGTLVSGGALGDSVCVVATSTTQYAAYPASGVWTLN